jgi:hypothetical protein
VRRRGFLALLGFAPLFRWEALREVSAPLPFFHSGGLDVMLTANTATYSSSITESMVLEAASSIKRYGPRERWVCFSPKFAQKTALYTWTEHGT